MATDTLHYHLKKPASADRVAIGDINDNSDTIDGYLYQANERADQLADDYNTSSTYNTGDYVRRDNYIYKCNTDDTTGTWDDAKWDRVKITEELGNGGGGSSTLAGLNDVNISSPTDGQALVYDIATGKWVNRAGGGGSSTFAGLNDVDVAGVANKDIARFNSSTNKWEKSSALTDLELTVSQMSASTLPYDANTDIKQKIDNVESSIPTNASDLPYSSGVSTKEKIDDVANHFTFELIGTKAFNVNQFLNPQYTEYFIEANIENDLSVVIPMTLTRQQLKANSKTFRTGYYVNSSNYGTIAITTVISGNDIYIKLSYFNIGGTSYSNSVMTVYGR